MTYITRLEKLTKEILSDELNFLTLKASLNDYKSMLIELSSLDLNEDKNRKNIQFNSGVAIGTTWAAMCIDDLMRTRQFLRGVFQAVEDVHNKTKKTVRILYAGSGPFATLVLPLITKYSSDELKITVLEVNEETFMYLKNVIKNLNIEDYFEKIICTNAVKYKIDESQSIDILLSETMQQSLVKEQQVPIMLNLVNQLSENTIILPQKIELNLALRNGNNKFLLEGRFDKSFKTLTTLIEFDKTFIDTYLEKKGEYKNKAKIEFCKNVDFRLKSEMKYHELSILTDIQIYKNEWLRLNQSGLTMPRKLVSLSNIEENKTNISITYVMDDNPKLEYELN